jgi:hypothetical protein
MATGLVIVLGSAPHVAAVAEAPRPQTSPDAVDQVVARCEADLLKGVCRVQQGASTVSDPEQMVFVAGFGAIDAEAYRRLRDAGPSMCQWVREACRRDWSGTDCKAARALHGQGVPAR